MYYNNKNKTKSQDKSKYKSKTDRTGDLKNLNSTLISKTYREMGASNPIEVKADPYSEYQRVASTYNIFAPNNKVMDGYYQGKMNILGNSIIKMTNSQKSHLMYYCDFISLTKKINYLYLEFYKQKSSDKSEVKNYAMLFQMVKNITTALSYGASTLMMQLPFMVDKFTSEDAPDITKDTYSFAQADYHAYSVFQALYHYQTVLQNLASVLTSYNTLMSQQDNMRQAGSNHEEPILNNVFSQLSKSTFVTALKSISTTLMGEYFDSNWYKQVNTVTAVPSRRSNGIIDPVLTMIATHKVPQLTMKTAEGDVEYYNSNNLVIKDGEFDFDQYTITGRSQPTKNYSLEEYVEVINRALNSLTIQKWARLITQDTFLNRPASADEIVVRTESSYVENFINIPIRKLTHALPYFINSMSDLRTFLDKIKDTGLLYWNKDVFIKPDPSIRSDYVYNKLLSDILSASVSGPQNITYNRLTGRWQLFTLWDKVEGIPTYDQTNSGSFLSFSVRKAGPYAPNNTSLDNLSTEAMFPVLFTKCDAYPDSMENNPGETQIQVISRNGYYFYPEVTNLPGSSIYANQTFAHLLPLYTPDLNFKLLTFNKSQFKNWTAQDSDLPRVLNAVMESTKNIFSMERFIFTIDRKLSKGSIDPDTNEKLSKSKTFHDVAIKDMIKPSIITLVDVELTDITDAVITYTRNYSPFKLTTIDGERTIGFGK